MRTAARGSFDCDSKRKICGKSSLGERTQTIRLGRASIARTCAPRRDSSSR